MIKYLFIAILAFSWTDALSQSIGISPVSHKLWGDTRDMSEFYLEYKFVGLHYFHNWDDTRYMRKGTDEIIEQTSAFAISVIPLDLTYFRAGMIAFDRRFPVDVASRVQFLLEASIPIRRFTISYRHISNGFGLFNEINPGVDSFSVKVHFGNVE
ncbi:hypothetical protein [Rhodohalobacter sulfatireducens]|uniref:Acyloxyacyl hydrolase n=1 Tax=Rhodohalobacter sulfatireducens TaxID=2911366 RepID=A0ABS9KJN3_9BACT|nr:hypothetical protein [Rhodohalobacter sulfatireducens]MCG2591060.1 hypothetical protein [Rhodohalobacter sulfatireducens]